MQKSKLLNTKSIFLICLVGFLIFIVIKVIEANSEMKQARAEELPSTYLLPLEYSNVIAERYRSMLDVKKVLNSKVRGPISLITFDQKYSLILYKIKLSKSDTLKKLFHSEVKSIDRSTGY